jgi:hypothetical protein
MIHNLGLKTSVIKLGALELSAPAAEKTVQSHVIGATPSTAAEKTVRRHMIEAT